MGPMGHSRQYISEILENPAWFLHNIRSDNGALIFAETSRKILADQAFHDGRTSLSQSGRKAEIPLDLALKAGIPTTPDTLPDRFIFHMAFCRSTWLTRILDHPGHSLAYREPQALIDLSAFRHDSRYLDLLALLRSQFRKSWSKTETAFVKPSNWANDHLPALFGRSHKPRCVFITLSLESYLVAVLRGGRERVAYGTRLFQHLLALRPDLYKTTQTVMASSMQPLEKTLCLCALGWLMQKHLFRHAQAEMTGTNSLCIDLEDLRTDPEASVKAAATALALDLPADMIAEGLSRWSGIHAKGMGEAYDGHSEKAANAIVRAHHGALVRACCDWLDTHLPASDHAAA